MLRYRWLRRCLPVAVGLSVLALIAPTTPASASPGPLRETRAGSIQVIDVSNSRPQLASGGEALVEVKVPPGERESLQVLADGRDVTSVFARQADGALLGLVTGLRLGDNTIVARPTGPGGRARGRVGVLHVVNHPITGPVFSGPQQTPFICQTQAFGLPPAVQPLCSAPTQVSYLYRNTAGRMMPLADPSSRPADLASTTVNGTQVPYIVRLEQGTIDRAVYQLAALYDGRAPNPLQPDTSWNGKLVYTFGGGCDAGFHQGTFTGGVLDNLFLSQGYAVASSTLNVLQTNCSTIISAEAAMMVKEHFIDTYGPVRYTIGWGASGGAIQQYDIADAYPGILNGIIPGLSFPDPATTGGPVSDCRLLDGFFGYPAQASSTVFNGFTLAQMSAVAGYSDYESCVSWDQLFANAVTATGSCDPSIPKSLLWNPVTNPDGVKCSLAQQLVTQLGVDPKTGFARSPLDNVGVQYGLAALVRGQITPAQFAALNAGIGGFDVAGNHVAQRTEADPQALTAAYRDDLVLSAAEGLTDTPTIDMRDYVDAVGFGLDIHTASWSFVIRQRLERSGAAANQVIIENSPDPATSGQVSAFELAEMDQWLNAITSDPSGRPLPVKVRSDKPGTLTDGCFLNGTYVHETLTYGGHGTCETKFPAFADPRLVAGESLAENVLKCQLKPLDFRDYPVTFTPAEQAELRAAFPTGVCDYQRPGVGQQPPLGTWLSYGPPPVSSRQVG